MADNKPRQKTRSHRQSRGARRSSKPVQLTDVQLVLLGKGFMDKSGHRSTFTPKRLKRDPREALD